MHNENTREDAVGQPDTAAAPITEQTVRTWRLQIDGLTTSVKLELTPSREVSLCITSLQKAKAWLGETLKAIGTANPYPESSNPESKKIEPQAEHGGDRETFVRFPTQLERVKAMRGAVQNVIDAVRPDGDIATGTGAWQRDTAYMNLIEAKYWLGWELDRIRGAQESNGITQRPSLPESLF